MGNQNSMASDEHLPAILCSPGTLHLLRHHRLWGENHPPSVSPQQRSAWVSQSTSFNFQGTTYSRSRDRVNHGAEGEEAMHREEGRALDNRSFVESRDKASNGTQNKQPSCWGSS